MAHGHSRNYTTLTDATRAGIVSDIHWSFINAALIVLCICQIPFAHCAILP
jgi:hypothetical protein